MKTKRCNPRWAGLLSFLVPGLGHLYCGRPWPAALIAAGYLVVTNVAIRMIAHWDLSPLNIILPLLAWLAYVLIAIAWAVVVARRAPADYRVRSYNRWYWYVFIWVAWGVAGQYLWFAGVTYRSFVIPSASMEDTLLVDDYVLADMTAYRDSDPQRGEVVIVIYPRDGVTKYVERCVALPGDTLEIRDKTVFINGAELPDPSTAKHIDDRIKPRSDGGADSRDNFGPYVVPQKHFFMMGDNRDNAFDSRFWGPARRGLIIGKVLRVTYSPDWNRVGMRVE